MYIEFLVKSASWGLEDNLKHQLNKTLNSIFQSGERLLYSGSLILLPYLSLYLVSFLLDTKAKFVIQGFVFFNLIVVSLFLFTFLFRIFTNSFHWQTALFWFALFLFFLVPGVYLEYPADPWEHVRRVISWQYVEKISEADLPYKSAYSIYWSLVKSFSIENRFLVFSFIAALPQLLLSFQIYRLAKALRVPHYLSLLQAFAFVVLFGTSIFGIRYYALSTMPFAYIGFLQIAIIILTRERFSNKKNVLFSVIEIVLNFLLIVFNHKQEIIFLALFLTVFCLCKFVYPLLRKNIKLSSIIILSLGSLGIVITTWFKIYTPELFKLLPDHMVTIIGSYNVFVEDARVINTLGVHGLLGVLFAVLYFRKYPLTSSLTIFPLLILVYPPFFVSYINILPAHFVIYRVLYAFPASFMLVLGVMELLKTISFKKYRLLFSSILILLISLPYQEPWCGRLFFQIHQPPKERTFLELSETAKWFNDNLKLTRDCFFLNNNITYDVIKWNELYSPSDKHCFIFSDPISSFILSSQFGVNYRMVRLRPKQFDANKEICEQLEDITSKYQFSNLAVLLADPTKLPQVVDSKVSNLAGHWWQEHAKIKPYLPTDNTYIEECLSSKGWRKERVPPYYDIFIYEKKTAESKKPRSSS